MSLEHAQRMVELREAMENAKGGGNYGDIEEAAAAVEEHRFSMLREAAECVVATAWGETYGLTEAQQLEALRLACVGLRDALTLLSAG